MWEGSANATGLGLSFPLAQLFRGGSGAPPPAAVRVRDVLAHADNGTATHHVAFSLGAIPLHGAVFVVLTPSLLA